MVINSENGTLETSRRRKEKFNLMVLDPLNLMNCVKTTGESEVIEGGN